MMPYIDGLVQERCNSNANALELPLSCTNPSIWHHEAQLNDVRLTSAGPQWLMFQHQVVLGHQQANCGLQSLTWIPPTFFRMFFRTFCQPNDVIQNGGEFLQNQVAVNSVWISDATCYHRILPSLIQVMACHPFSAKPLSESMLTFCQSYPQKLTMLITLTKFKHFHSIKCV